MFEDIEDVEVVVDDILIWGENAITNQQDLQCFLGMITYFLKFIPHFSQVASPLRALLEKDIAWQWHHEYEQSLLQLKELATIARVLAYFKPGLPVKLSVNASSKGLGVILI